MMEHDYTSVLVYLWCNCSKLFRFSGYSKLCMLCPGPSTPYGRWRCFSHGEKRKMEEEKRGKEVGGKWRGLVLPCSLGEELDDPGYARSSLVLQK